LFYIAAFGDMDENKNFSEIIGKTALLAAYQVRGEFQNCPTREP
jgi:hypothetical protein